MQAGSGPSGFTKEGVRKDLSGKFNYVNSYKVGEDVAQAEKMLKEKGVWV